MLTKPGIIRGNILTTAAGFLLAAKGRINLYLLATTLIGTAMIIAAGCIINNYLDRRIDAKMARTKSRGMVTGNVSVPAAMTTALVLALSGLFLLAEHVNKLTFLLGLLGLFFYTVMYSVWKRRSSISTVIGSIAGAIPPTAGYTAVTGRIDAAAILLFSILVSWQMPHFYAIGMFRSSDYKAAGIPILPLVKGAKVAKLHSKLYILSFITGCILLSVLGYTGWVFLTVMMATGWYWLKFMYSSDHTDNGAKWGRQMFKLSLRVIMVFSILIALEAYLP